MAEIVDAAGTPASAPSPNGARTAAPSRPRWRWVAAGVTVVVAAAWGFALWYSLERSGPEPLDPDAAEALAAACRETLGALARLPQLEPDASTRERLARLEAEAPYFEGLLARGRSVAAAVDRGADALEAWLDDWEALLAARDDFAAALARSNARRLVVPTDGRGRPVTVRMDEYARFHGFGQCSPVTLQAETVDGERFYPE